MIDREWFAKVCELSGIKLTVEERAKLCELLGEPEEILPYLVMTLGGFAEWPLSRAALHRAARSLTRSTLMRPSMGAAGAGRTQSPETLATMLNALLVSASIDWTPDWEEHGPITAEVEHLLRAVRLETGQFIEAPQLFIRSD